MIILLLIVLAGRKLIEQAPELLIGVTTRLTDDTVSSGGGRFGLAVAYLNAMTENVRVALIGAGTTYYSYVLGISGASHTGTIQVLACYGLIGSVIFFWGILSPLRRCNQAKAPMLYCLPYIGCVIFVQTIQFINPTYLIFPYIICAYAIFEGRGYTDRVVNC